MEILRKRGHRYFLVSINQAGFPIQTIDNGGFSLTGRRGLNCLLDSYSFGQIIPSHCNIQSITKQGARLNMTAYSLRRTCFLRLGQAPTLAGPMRRATQAN